MLDDCFLDELRHRMPVSDVVARYMTLTRAGRELKGLSPFNKERSPSFFVNDDKRAFFDFSSGRHGDIFAFVMAIEGVGFPEAVAKISAIAGRTPGRGTPKASPLVQVKPETKWPHAEALQLWHEAVHPAGTPVIAYLHRRGLILPKEAAGEAIRFHPKCKFGLRRVPCMIALVRDVRTNEPKAIHRTALDLAGKKVEIDGNDRLTLGPVGGGAVKLTEDADVITCLGIGEGIESTLSMQLAPEFGASPIWALLSAGEVIKFPVLRGIESIWIAVDHDENNVGQSAAQACAERWAAAGQEVFRITPNKVGNDLNDLAQEVR